MTSTSAFSVSAPADTDIWKKPPSHNVFNAPHHPLAKNPLRDFISASITFSAAYTLQFDQAGFLLTFTKPSSPSTPRKWIKAGIEFFNNQPRLSTVCCDNWADWSVASLDDKTAAEDVQAGRKAVTISVEKETSSDGSCLWIYQIDGDTKVPMREICWVYGDDGGEQWEVGISALVARPAKQADGVLEVEFKDFEVKWATA